MASPDYSKAVDTLCEVQAALTIVAALAEANDRAVTDAGIADPREHNEIKIEARVVRLSSEVVNRLKQIEADIERYLELADSGAAS